MISRTFNCYVLFICMTIYNVACYSPSADDAFFEDVVSLKSEEGQKQYNIIKQESRMPKYGTCWKQALLDLESGCKHLTDDVQTRLALSFANCFLKKTGKNFHPCETDQEVTECLKNADDLAVSTMSTFFTHTHSMCFFLQSQVWHDETKKTVVNLVDASARVSKSLEMNNELQGQILEAQKTVLNNEEVILQTGEDLKLTLSNSKQSVIDVLNEFKSSTNEQKMAIFEVFDRISKLQNLVLGEFTGLYTLLFFVSAAGVAYLLTSTRRTSGARFGVFVVLTLNFAAEKMVISWAIQSQQLSTETIIYEWIWVCRKISCLICLFILGFVAYHYQDYESMNNHLLQEIRKESLEVKQLLNMFNHYAQPNHLAINGGPPQITNAILPNGGAGDMYRHFNGIHQGNVSPNIDLDRDDPEDDNYQPDSSDSSSDSSEDSYQTLEDVSRPPSVVETRTDTPHKDERRSVTPSIGRQRKATPLREMNMSRGGSPYNLRPRGGASAAGGTAPAAYMKESPQQFAAVIDSLSRLAQMHSMRVRQAVNRGHLNASSGGQFSDDD